MASIVTSKFNLSLRKWTVYLANTENLSRLSTPATPSGLLGNTQNLSHPESIKTITNLSYLSINKRMHI